MDDKLKVLTKTLKICNPLESLPRPKSAAKLISNVVKHHVKCYHYSKKYVSLKGKRGSQNKRQRLILDIRKEVKVMWPEAHRMLMENITTTLPQLERLIKYIYALRPSPSMIIPNYVYPYRSFDLHKIANEITTIMPIGLNSSGDRTFCYMYNAKRGTYSSIQDDIISVISLFVPGLSRNRNKDMYNAIFISLRMKNQYIPHPVSDSKTISPCFNGIFDIEKQKLMPFTPKICLLWKLGTKYDDTWAKNDLWKSKHPFRNLPNIPDGMRKLDPRHLIRNESNYNPTRATTLKQIIRMAVTPSLYNRLVLLIGEKGTGKSIFLIMITNVVNGNVANLIAALNLANIGGKFDTDSLLGKPLDISHENSGVMRNPQKQKVLIDHELTSVEPKFQNKFMHAFMTRFIQASNHDINFPNGERGSIGRRILLVRFDNKQIYGHRNIHLKSYLKTKSFRQWLLYTILRKDVVKPFSKYTVCQADRQYLKSHIENSDSVVKFVKKEFLRVIRHTVNSNVLPEQLVYLWFKAWRKSESQSSKALSKNRFLTRIKNVMHDDFALPPYRSGRKTVKLDQLQNFRRASEKYTNFVPMVASSSTYGNNHTYHFTKNLYKLTSSQVRCFILNDPSLKPDYHPERDMLRDKFSYPITVTNKTNRFRIYLDHEFFDHYLPNDNMTEIKKDEDMATKAFDYIAHHSYSATVDKKLMKRLKQIRNQKVFRIIFNSLTAFFGIGTIADYESLHFEYEK